MNRIEDAASRCADKYVEGSLSMSADAGHGAFQDGFIKCAEWLRSEARRDNVEASIWINRFFDERTKSLP